MSSQYYISFGGFSLYTAASVRDENGRELSSYDSVGGGKFNVPDSRNPKTWEIEAELSESSKYNMWRASEITKACDSLLDNAKDPSRLVVTNKNYPSANISVLAWFKGYTKEEKEPGVYDVTFRLEEYKPVGVKTTDIPYVTRPGKIPIPPKVTITKKNTVYSQTKKIVHTGVVADFKKIDYKDTKTGKPVANPAAVKAGTTYIVSTPKTVGSINAYSSATGTSVSAADQWQGVKDVAAGVGELAGGAWKAISTAFNKFGASVESWSKTLG
nr:MAG TPA: hypothetical protein [Caudoviricetes sp.]